VCKFDSKILLSYNLEGHRDTGRLKTKWKDEFNWDRDRGLTLEADDAS
jgi:hypothetical protein